MEYLNPTDARILIRKRLGHFLSGSERLFAVIAPAHSGRKTIVNRLLADLSLQGRTEYCIASGSVNFYEYLNRFDEADVLLIEDSTITSAKGSSRDWYMDALDRIRQGLPVKHPNGPREDGFPPSSMRVRQKIILLVEAQQSYHPAWKRISGVAFDDSAADLHNYIQRERESILGTHGISNEALDGTVKELRTLCRSQPEYFAKPKPDSPADLNQLIGAMKQYDAGEEAWKDVFESWRERANQDLRAKRADAHYGLDRFQILDGARGRLILPRMIEAFIKSDKCLFSFILRYPVHLQRWDVEALEKIVPKNRVVHVNKTIPKKAIALYRALDRGKNGSVVIVDYLIDISAKSNDNKEVIKMIHQVAEGETVTRPTGADEDLPESIEFTGKLFLLDEGIPKSGKMRQLVENNPGLQILDSLADTVHRLAWWDNTENAVERSGEELEKIDLAEWRRFLATLFKFVVRFPDQTVTRLNAGPSERILLKARNDVIASGGDLHNVDNFELESSISDLGYPAEEPDQTIESFEQRLET